MYVAPVPGKLSVVGDTLSVGVGDGLGVAGAVGDELGTGDGLGLGDALGVGGALTDGVGDGLVVGAGDGVGDVFLTDGDEPPPEQPASTPASETLRTSIQQ